MYFNLGESNDILKHLNSSKLESVSYVPKEKVEH